MAQPAPKPISRWLAGLCGAFIFFLVSFLTFQLVGVLSGKSDSAGTSLPISFAFLGLGVGFYGASLANKNSHVVTPDDVDGLIQNALAEAGVKGVRTTYWTEMQTSDFPRPIVMGNNLSISRRVAEEFSPAALAWSVKTDIAASRAFTRAAVPTFFAFVLSLLVFFCLGERWKFSNLVFLIGFAVFVAGFVGWGFWGYLFQVAADRRFTRTERDRAAAKEALGYPYFAQRDRSFLKRWAFLPGELRGRARRLGIELERGYKAPLNP
jgi:hypothetical protein